MGHVKNFVLWTGKSSKLAAKLLMNSKESAARPGIWNSALVRFFASGSLFRDSEVRLFASSGPVLIAEFGAPRPQFSWLEHSGRRDNPGAQFPRSHIETRVKR